MPRTDAIPERYLPRARAIAEALDALEAPVCAAHVNPDGDALGSLICAGLLAQAKGKSVTLYSSTGIPDFLSFFPSPFPIIQKLEQSSFQPKSAFFVDIGDFHRIGGDLEAQAAALPSIQVDHHEGPGIGSLAAWVEPKAAATTELLAYVGLALGLKLDGLFGQAVALGLITDTGGFSHANTSAEVFALCAELARSGINFAALREEIDGNMRHERMSLWAQLAQKVELRASGRLAVCVALESDLAACGALREDLEGFVEYLRRLRGVEIAVLVKEVNATLCKYSLRSGPTLDVCAVAQGLHGGGHKNAAGGTLTMTAPAAKAALLTALLPLLG